MEIPEDIKKVLIAVDQLLEALPPDEIDKFVNSPEFPMYERIMNQIYNVEPEEPVAPPPPEPQGLVWEKTQEQSGPIVETLKVETSPETRDLTKPIQSNISGLNPPREPRDLSTKPFQLKQPIERLKQPSFSLEKDIQAAKAPSILPHNEAVQDVEQDYKDVFEKEEKSREAQKLEEFSNFLRSKKTPVKTPGTEDERQLVEYINQQIDKGLREIDIRVSLAKVGWSADVLDKSLEIARNIRVRDGKAHVKKFGVDFM